MTSNRRTTLQAIGDTTSNRRTALRAIGGAVAFGVGLGAAGSGVAQPDEEPQENYAEIKFNPQRTDGGSVRVARYLPRQDGFITIHTWELITEQDGAGTIAGLSPLFGPGKYSNVEVQLFGDGTSSTFGDQDRLERDQRLVAVPHRDMDFDGSFEPPIDVPFSNGTQVRDDLPFPGAVNDWSEVKVVPDNGKGN